MIKEDNKFESNTMGGWIIPAGTNLTGISQIPDYSEIGNNCEISNDCKIGDDCFIGDGCKIGDACEIGNNCVVGDNCEFGKHCTVAARFMGNFSYEKLGIFVDRCNSYLNDFIDEPITPIEIDVSNCINCEKLVDSIELITDMLCCHMRKIEFLDSENHEIKFLIDGIEEEKNFILSFIDKIHPVKRAYMWKFLGHKPLWLNNF